MSRSTGESRVSSLVGQEIDGRYRVDSVIARGGMGVVLRGTHLVLGQPVAIKVMLDATMRDANMRERFLREARILAQVRSPAIASIFDAGTLQDGTPYLVMELLEGEDLEQILARGTMTPDRAARIGAQICEGLAEAHDQGIVHRDLKPANVFVVQRPSGEKLAKIIDFGISKRLGEVSETTGVNTLVGSPYYMAPEQVYASRDVDRRADIWSIGVILYRLVVGAQPFEAPTLPAILVRIKSSMPTFPDDLDADFVEVITRCLAKDRGKRFQSALELRDVLMQFVSEGSRSAFALPLDEPRPSSSMPRASRPSIPNIAPSPPPSSKSANEPPRPPRMPSRPPQEGSPPPRPRAGEVSIARPKGIAEALGAISIAESDVFTDDDVGGTTLPGGPSPYSETDAFTEKRNPVRGGAGPTPYGDTDAFTEKVKPLARPRGPGIPTPIEAIALRTSEIEVESDSDVAHDAKVTVPRMFPPSAAALKAATDALTRRAMVAVQAPPPMPPSAPPSVLPSVASSPALEQETPPDRMRIMSPAESWRPAWEGAGPSSSPPQSQPQPPSARLAQSPEPPLLPPVREQWLVGGAVAVALVAILVVMLSQCGEGQPPPPPRKPVVSATLSATAPPATAPPALVVLSPPPPDPVDTTDAGADGGHAK